MTEEKEKKNGDLKDVVNSKIKGLGLDALFHQVDVSQKDEDPNCVQRASIPFHEQDLINKLKDSFYYARPGGIKQKVKETIEKLTLSKDKLNVALTLGPTAIKLLALKGVKGKVSLDQAVYIPIPPIVTISKDKYEKFVIETLKERIDTKAIRQSFITTVVPRSKIITKIITLPTPDPQEVKKMIDFEAEHHLPFPLHDVELDYHIIRRELQSTMVLLSAIKKSDLIRILDLFKRIGIKPDSIDVSSLALYNAFLSSSPQEGITLQIHIGSESTDMNVVQDGCLKFSRGIPWGSKDLTEALASSLNVSFENAEKIKKENGILLTKKDENETKKTVSSLSCTWADKLIQEINRTLQHVYLQAGLKKVDRVFLVGGGARLMNLHEYLRDKLKVRTAGIKPPKDILINCQPEAYQRYFQEMNLLFGLAWRSRGYGRGEIEINLLPQKIKKSLIAREKRVKQLLITGIAAAALTALVVLPMGMMALRQSMIRGLDKKIQQLKPEVKRIKDLKEKIQTIEDYVSTEQSCMEILKELSLVVTYDIIIDRFSFEKNRTVTLVGEAGSHASAVNLSQTLQESEIFSNANLKYTRKIDRTKENVAFEIICTIKMEE